MDKKFSLIQKISTSFVLVLFFIGCSPDNQPSVEMISANATVDLNYDLKIKIDPGTRKQKVEFGADAKLPIKAWADNQTEEVARNLFEEMDLTMLRLPIFAMRTSNDPFYEKVIKVMKVSKSIKPDIKFFASVANGDGENNNNLHNQEKFPGSMLGCCPNNIYSLNLTSYAKRLDDFIQMLEDNDLYLDYIGPFNEDPAESSDYRKVFDQMQQVGNIQKVGLETWGLLGGINRIDDIEEELDIVGSHFYDDSKIHKNLLDTKWNELVEKSNKPVWYTEATRYKIDDNVENMVNGIANIIPPIRGGVENVIFYQANQRIASNIGSVRPYKYSAFKTIVNSATGKEVVQSQSSDEDVMVIAFADDEKLSLHVLNTSEEKKTARLVLEKGYFAFKKVKEMLWDKNNIEVVNEKSLGQRSGSYNQGSWNIELPSRSYLYTEMPYKYVPNKNNTVDQ